MTTVLDTIPGHLQHDVDSVLAWFNAREGGGFEVTGIVNPPPAAASGRELRLVLCGQGTCRQERIRVASAEDGQRIDWLGDDQAVAGEAVAELDPPPGARRGWIDRVAGQHAFVVLLFYRGFW